MPEWPVRPLGELTDNFDAIRVPVREADRRPGPYPYYGASGVVDHVDAYLYDGEYLLVAEDGENLRSRTTPVAFIAMGKFWVNNHAHVVRGNGESNTRFLMYALAITDISGYLTGSTMPKLTQGNLNRILVPAPHVAVQGDIADVLSALDGKIELNRYLGETLAATARALFKSWFVDFDPVRAKVEGRVADLDTSVADLFPDSLIVSDAGEVPLGWGVGSLSDLVEQRRDLVDPRVAPNDEFHHFSLPAYDNGQRPEIQRGSEIKSVKYSVPSGAVLLSKLNPSIPRIWLVDSEPTATSIASTEFLVLTPKDPASREYLYCLVQSTELLGRLQSLATGTSGSHQRARPDDVLGLPTLRPGPGVLAAFARIAAPILDRALVARRESRLLAALRDTLLPKLMSGELRVSDAERIAVEAGA